MRACPRARTHTATRLPASRTCALPAQMCAPACPPARPRVRTHARRHGHLRLRNHTRAHTHTHRSDQQFEQKTLWLFILEAPTLAIGLQLACYDYVLNRTVFNSILQSEEENTWRFNNLAMVVAISALRYQMVVIFDFCTYPSFHRVQLDYIHSKITS